MAHLYCATAHGKGFHDALGKLIARLLAKKEKFNLVRAVTSIDDFLYDDFEVVGYKPHKSIKMKMSV